MSFYKEPKWENLRETILRRDGYQCQLSKRYGKARPATMVHHIFPRSKYPEYSYSPWNLISLCNEVHNRMHYRTGDELTEEGAELLRRTARKNNIPIPEEYNHKIKKVYRYERMEQRFSK